MADCRNLLIEIGTEEIPPDKLISAHNTFISNLSLNFEGNFIASASQKGTLIRIYDTTSCELIRELRRGCDNAKINCISFSKDSSMLLTCSDRDTIHIFALNLKNKNNEIPKNQKSFLGKIIPIKLLSSEWSFSQFRINSIFKVGTFSSNNSKIIGKSITK